MNTTVTATNMKITAQSNTTYLLISRTSTTATDIQTEANTNIDVASISAKAVYPVAPGTVNAAVYYTQEEIDAAQEGDAAYGKTTSDIKTPVSHTAYDTSDPSTLAWYKMNGTSPDSSGYVGRAASEVAVTNPELESDYVLKYDLYFTLAAGSEDADGLYVSKVTFTGCDAAVRCLVVGETSSVIFSGTDADGDDTVVLNGTTDPMTDTDVVHVVVYVYYDGNETTIYTNNIANILAGQVSLEFSVSVA